MLPPIPTKLSQIDETTVGQHFLLNSTDVCYHIREYTRRGGFGASPTNNLISNLKKKPSKIQTNPREAPWKENAIGYCAQALQRMMNRPWIDGYGTLVRVLQRAFAGSTVDIRPLLTQSCSTTADHETSERQRFEELLAVTRVDEAIVGAGVRPHIMVFDCIK